LCAQLHVNVLPKSAAAALARLTGLSSLQIHAGGITQAVVDSALGCSSLTSLELHATGSLLPTEGLTQLPQRLPLLANLELSDGVRHGDDVEDVELPAPADLPHLRTFQINFEYGHRCFRVSCRQWLGAAHAAPHAVYQASACKGCRHPLCLVSCVWPLPCKACWYRPALEQRVSWP